MPREEQHLFALNPYKHLSVGRRLTLSSSDVGTAYVTVPSISRRSVGIADFGLRQISNVFRPSTRLRK